MSPATLEKEKESRGRKRFSLTNIFKHAKAGVSRERTHDRERSVDAERPSVVGRVSPEIPLEEMEEEDEHRPARSKSRGRGVIGRILRENLIDGGKENEDWTEFKPGECCAYMHICLCSLSSPRNIFVPHLVQHSGKRAADHAL